MSVFPQQTVSETSGAITALEALFHPFAAGLGEFDGSVVHPDAIPNPEDDLLVHHDHMTVVLERHHGKPVDVAVHEEHRQGDIYTRKISLSLRGDGTIVEWGICRLDFRHMADDVRDEILARKMPLGAVLIQHHVHRRVKPRYFMRFPEQSAIFESFNTPGAAEPTYGRIGTIYCNSEPAIELLEIVVNTR